MVGGVMLGFAPARTDNNVSYHHSNQPVCFGKELSGSGAKISFGALWSVVPQNHVMIKNRL